MSRVMSVVCRHTVVMQVFWCTDLLLVYCGECDAVTLLTLLSALWWQLQALPI